MPEVGMFDLDPSTPSTSKENRGSFANLP